MHAGKFQPLSKEGKSSNGDKKAMDGCITEAAKAQGSRIPEISHQDQGQ
jgi:hypothetical protein